MDSGFEVDSSGHGLVRLERGRGAVIDPANRFEGRAVLPDNEYLQSVAEGRSDAQRSPETRFLDDDTRSIISRNDSPDVGFDQSINPYRGCEHGCVYCYARPTHEYLGFSAGLDFETRILVKHRAPELLRAAMSRRGWKPEVLGLSGVTDPYQPIEGELGITRRCLEILADCRQPIAVVTKNHLVTRDIDHLSELARFKAVTVYLSITTLNNDLARVLEPRASAPRRRLEALEKLSAAGIPCGVLVAPVIPALNDHEISDIVAAAASAGAAQASMILLRLPHSLDQQFAAWLRQFFPLREKKVLSLLRQMRGGGLKDSTFGSRMRGSGPLAQNLWTVFERARTAAALGERSQPTGQHFRPPKPASASDQFELFG
jgi:DNA repair photolyase